MGFLEALALVFIILKLAGIISWGWLLVLSPLIAAAVFYVFLFIWYVVVKIMSA